MVRDGIAARSAAAGRIIVAIVGLVLAPGPGNRALAQEADSGPKPSPAQSKDQNAPVLEEVVITATGTNISGIKPVGSEELQLSRDDILNTGIQDLHDVLRSLPQVVDVSPAGVANIRQGGTSGYNANNTQGSAINLRGLGPQGTLLLVDGHRVTPTGTVAVFTEADQVPLAALGRRQPNGRDLGGHQRGRRSRPAGHHLDPGFRNQRQLVRQLQCRDRPLRERHKPLPQPARRQRHSNVRADERNAQPG